MDTSNIGLNCLKSEFQWRKFWLSHDHLDRFSISQFGPRYHKAYMVYRLLVTVWWTFVLTCDIKLYDFDATWLAYATNWSLLAIFISCLLQLSTCVLYMIKQHCSYGNIDHRTIISQQNESPTHTETVFWETDNKPTDAQTNSDEDFLSEEYLDSTNVTLDDDTAQDTGVMLEIELILCQVQWVVYNISCNNALVVTAFYWIYYNIGINYSRFLVYSLHLVNSVYVVVDFMISAIPIRILHIWYVLLNCVVYFTFILIYEYCGGPAPYEELNWLNRPTKSTITMSAVMFFSLLIQLLLYALYLIRQKLYCLF